MIFSIFSEKTPRSSPLPLLEDDKGTSSKNRTSLRDRKRKSEDIVAPTTPTTPTESRKSSLSAKRSKSEDKPDTPRGSPSQNSRDSRDRDKTVFDQNLNRTNLSPQVVVKPVRTPHISRVSVRENQVQQQPKDNSKTSEDTSNHAISSPPSNRTTTSPRLAPKSLRKAATPASSPSNTETNKVPKPPVPSPGNSRPGTPSRGKSPSRSSERQSPRTTRANVFESRKATETSLTKVAASRTPRNSPSRNPAALKETPSARPSTRDSVKNQETSGGKSPRSYSESPVSRSPRTTRRSDDPSPVLRKPRQKPTTPKQESETKTPTVTKPKCDTNPKSSTSSNNTSNSSSKATTPSSRTKPKVTSGNLKTEPVKDKVKDTPEKEKDSVDTKDIVAVETKPEPVIAQSSKVSDKLESGIEKVQPVKNQTEPPTKVENKVAESKPVVPECKVETSLVKPVFENTKDTLQVQNAKKVSSAAAAETAQPAGSPAGRVAVSRPSAASAAAPQSPAVKPAVSTPVVPAAPAARSSSAPAVPAHPAVTAPRPVVPEITAARPAVPIGPAPSALPAGPLNLTTHSPRPRQSHKTSLLPPPKRAGEMHFKKMHLLNDASNKGQSSTEGSKGQDPYSSSGIDVSHSITDQIAKHSKERDKLNWNNNDVHASTAPHLEPHSGSYNGDSSTPHGAGESVRSSTSTINNGDVSRERDPRYHLPHPSSGESHPHSSHNTDSHTGMRPSSHHHSPSMTLPSHGLPDSSRHLSDSRPKDLSLGSAAGSDYERSQSRSSDDRAASRSSADEKRPSSSSSSLSNPRLDDYRRKEMEAHGNSPLVFDKNKPVEVYRDPELLKRDQLRYLQQSQAQALRASAHTPIPPASSYPPHAAVSSPAHAAALAQHARTLPMAAYGSSALGALSGLSPHLGLSHSALVAEHSAALRSLTASQQAALIQQQYAALGLSQHLSSYMQPSLQTQQLEVLWQQKYPTLPVPPAWMLNQYQDELLRDVHMLRDRDLAMERERREREMLRERAERERAERDREVREREER